MRAAKSKETIATIAPTSADLAQSLSYKFRMLLRKTRKREIRCVGWLLWVVVRIAMGSWLFICPAPAPAPAPVLLPVMILDPVSAMPDRSRAGSAQLTLTRRTTPAFRSAGPKKLTPSCVKTKSHWTVMSPSEIWRLDDHTASLPNSIQPSSASCEAAICGQGWSGPL